ncbi:MAG: class B sortase [Erysipelotrichaceae bacterium]|nr:class B sortase [Erysipelotrichaceae bacterium]
MKLISYFIIGTITIIKFPFLFLKYFFIGLFTIITIIPHYVIIGFKFLFQKNDKTTTKKNIELENKIIPTITLTLSIITYLISIFLLSRWFVQNERTKNFTKSLNSTPIINQEDMNKDTPDQYKDLTEIIPKENTDQNFEINTNYINVNLNYYIQKNPETVAWIQVNGTNVNYPIVQHSDNEYYLEHDFYQRKTNIGWIFGDYRNNFDSFNNNTIIYGHNLINGTMFGSIPKLLNSTWFSNPNNHYIKLSTKTTNSIWQIFSVYKIEPTTDYLQAKFNSTIAYQDFLNKLKNRSSYQFNIDVNYTDKIITLSTCDNIGTKRVAVHAKLIKIENK